MIAQPPPMLGTPEWIAAEMPPGYQNRIVEIQRLSEELQLMDRFGRLLWQVGDELAEAVLETFVAMGCEADRISSPATAAAIGVRLEGRGRLLVHASATSAMIQKRDPELTHVFQLVHQVAEESDRVVLVTNCEPGVRPAARGECLGEEALALLRRLGVNILPGPALFGMWALSLQDRPRAHIIAQRLQEQDGGVFALPVAV